MLKINGKQDIRIILYNELYFLYKCFSGVIHISKICDFLELLIIISAV